jgi:tetratricopeptide (TPR) repeat protein
MVLISLIAVAQRPSAVPDTLGPGLQRGDRLYRAELFAEALQVYQIVLQHAEASSDTATMTNALSMLGIIHGRSGNSISGSEYLERAGRLAAAAHDTTLLIRCRKGLGNLHELAGEHANALALFGEALKLARHAQDTLAELSLLNNMGASNTKLGELAVADQQLRSALALAEWSKNQDAIVMTLSNLGNNMVAGRHLQEAIAVLERALIGARANGLRDYEATILLQRGDAYRALGASALALEDITRAQELDDSLNAERNTARIAELETHFQLDLRRAEIARMEAEHEKSEALLRMERERATTQRGLIIGVSIIALLAIAGLYHVLRRSRTIRRLNARLVEQRDVIHGKNEELVTTLAETERLRRMIKHDLDHYRSVALRKQMDPHFVFNCLNSIQRSILQEDKKDASLRLSRFARLIRKVLELAEQELVPVSEELAVVEMYVGLEAQRFNGHFTYSAHGLEDVDIHLLAMPPMLLQPHVENAIHHGLMNKEGERALDLHLRREDDVLVFVIEDNGIGREAAAAYARNGGGTHRSMGQRLTSERIDLLRSTLGANVDQRVLDLVDADGLPAGTRVEVRLPVLFSTSLTPVS